MTDGLLYYLLKTLEGIAQDIRDEDTNMAIHNIENLIIYLNQNHEEES